MSELPKLESVPSKPSENVGNALTEESSSESRESEETLSAKEIETNLIGASLDKNASPENTEIVDSEVSDKKSKSDEVLDTSETGNSKDEAIPIKMTEGSKKILETKHTKDVSLTLEVTEEIKDILKTNDSKDEPIAVEMTEESEGDIEANSKTDESNASEVDPGVIEENSKTNEAIVSETALENEASNAGDAEAEKMEIETEVLPPETEELENDVEMVEENASNDKEIKIPSTEEENNDSFSEEKSENLHSKEKKENSPCEEKSESPLNEESDEMNIDQDVVAEESTSAANLELEVIEDSSSKNSMDSETLAVQPDVSVSEKVAVDEGDIKSEDNAAAAAGEDTEEKKVLFMPIDLGIDPGPLEDFTAQEIMDYLGKKVTEYMMNPEINRLLRVQMESVQLRDQVRAKTEELNRLQAFMEKLNRDQDKFLRHFGILPKIPTADKSVHVDWASVESFTANNVKEQIQKNEQLTLTPCGTSPKNNATATNTATGTSILKKSPVPKKDGPVECIDLTDEIETPNKAINKAQNFKSHPVGQQAPMKSPNKLHPAPLPIMPNRVNRYLKESPPKPRVKISCDDKGIILQWDADITDKHEKLQCFEIFGYQEQKNQNITSALWKRIGNVKTLSLPMACTLTKFVPGNNYHFTVRGLDVHNRPGVFSDPVSTRFDPVFKKA